MKLFRDALIFFTLISSLNTLAVDIFVSTTGNDNNPGTKTQPLATLNAARDAIRLMKSKGNTDGQFNVVIMNGTYHMDEPLVLNENDGGSEGSPVTYRGESDTGVILSGGIEIRNWEKVNDNLWKAKIPEVVRFGFYFEQLFVNGKWAVRAKSPNSGFYYVKKVRESVLSQQKETAENTDSKVNQLAIQEISLFPQDANIISSFSPKDFEDALFVFYHKWDNTRKHAVTFDADSSSVFTVGNGMKPWNVLDKKTRYTVENFKAALDTAGEWYLDRSGYLYYIPRRGETLESVKAIAPVTDEFIVLRGTDPVKRVENIKFENLHFSYAGYKTPLLGNEPSQAATLIGAAITVDYARNIEFVNCEVSHIGGYAIWFRKGCSDCSVSHCYLNNLGAGGIKVGGTVLPVNEKELTRNITVDNNIIRSGGFVFPCAVGIIIYHASDNTITHNEIADFGYTGISAGWVWGYSYSPTKRNRIEYNHIHHLGWGNLSDMGGIYLLGASQGTSVRFNVIHDVYSYDYGGWGLYTDEGAEGIILENNLVYNCKSSAFHQHYGKDNIVRNNIFVNQIRAQLEASRIEPHTGFRFTNNIIYYSKGNLTGIRWDEANFVSDSNLYWDTRARDIMVGKFSFSEWQKSGKDVHSVIADPGFADLQNHDFLPKNNKAIKKIGFKPFDYSKAGVYGQESWLQLARTDPEMVKKFNEARNRNEKRELGD